VIKYDKCRDKVVNSGCILDKYIYMDRKVCWFNATDFNHSVIERHMSI